MPTEHIFKAGTRSAIIVTANLYGPRRLGHLGTPAYIPSAISAAQPITIDARQSKITLPLVGGAQTLVDSGAFTDPQGTVGGTVPATLVADARRHRRRSARSRRASPESTRRPRRPTSSAPRVTRLLTVSDPGRLINGAFALAEPLRGLGVLQDGLDRPGVQRRRSTSSSSSSSSANDPLRTGTYSKTLTFTLAPPRLNRLTCLRPRLAARPEDV